MRTQPAPSKNPVNSDMRNIPLDQCALGTAQIPILNKCASPPTGHPVDAVTRVRLTPNVAVDLQALADPGEIAVAAILGIIKDGGALVTGLVRFPNHADAVYPAKGRQRAWTVDWPMIERLEGEAGRQTPQLQVLGILHTHRHGKSLPSALDWRRPRAKDLAGIYHPGSGVLTLYIRGTTRRKGRIVARLAATPSVAGYAAAIDLDKAEALCPLTR